MRRMLASALEFGMQKGRRAMCELGMGRVLLAEVGGLTKVSLRLRCGRRRPRPRMMR
jgi:hypothetical protein